MKIGFIGLGIMGSRMSANLQKRGYPLVVYNRTREKAQPLLANGAQWADSPAALAAEADVIFTMLAHPDAVKEAALGRDGFLVHFARGRLWTDCSSVNPSFSRAMAAEANKLGVHFIDAPVTGSKIGAENGQLIFIVGGAQEPVEYLDPLFKAMGKQVIHVGPVGKGQAAKLGMNLMIALYFQGFSEAMVLVRKLGVEPHKLVELIQASMVKSGVVDYKAPFVLRHDYSPNFPLRLMHKDIHIMLDMAKELFDLVRAGKIVNEQDVERALNGIFKEQTLYMLRELLLRTVDSLTLPVVRDGRTSMAAAFGEIRQPL